MKVTFTDAGREDYCSWSGDSKALRRINRMIDEARRDPGSGIGKTERLVANLSGCWSRRIDQEHRLVYTVKGDELIVVQARYHY